MILAMLRRDPGLFVLTCAIWALINGVSLLAWGDTFQRAAMYFTDFVRLGLRENWVGAAMLADAVALFLTVSRGSAGLRSLVAIASAPAWFFFGALMLIGASRAGLFTVVGAYDMVAALGLAACGVQWSHTLLPPGTIPGDSASRNAALTGGDEPWT
jgi:hypothetical protein